MFWLTRPPYLRWMMAGTIVVGAAVWDLAGRATEPFPFAGRDIASGELIAGDAIEWQDVPVGLMDAPDLSSPVASRPLVAGEPIVAAAVAGDASIPDGWWAVPLPLPAAAVAGTPVRLVIVEPALDVEGIVVAAGNSDLLSMADAGLVAVPGDAAAVVARAAAEGAVTVLVRP